ncbi:hypothetical protein WBP07_25985 [Novosphingobium sp. BL-8A]|uniref:hypothetical protein n=1 Tax=Novosphingobium sp. BL-8A TaxID=3127639 RepID=UPI003757FC64
MRNELGFQRWEAIDHFLGYGDYLNLNEFDFRGAIAEYENAWELLDTPWQQEVGGADILEGIADFALKSGDPKLAGETLSRLLPRATMMANSTLREACERLAEQASHSDD